ncbi:MAG: isocitrate/isopropylmalate dehydrogenase family protein [Pleurocapsa minor GSE-CHR-MK-17-07R]|jgi:homoisocitrate dehydrogenase|nr:isocitrate/isopropylmalate dehydrogenase family protein [Pleurocapsa minor GSE-CHR-MK 17-07R]
MTETPVLITLINGDGIGAEVIPAAESLLRALNLPLAFQHADAGFGTFERTGDALPRETLDACAASAAVLFGATQSPMTKVAGYSSPILTLRRHFDLFCNLRPARGNGLDMLIVRENTEGLYSRRERVEDGGQTAIAERVITARASARITRAACEWALRRRHKLTIIHKANVLKETCGLFRETALDVVKEFPALTVEEGLIDSAAMLMAQDALAGRGDRYDVIVTTNLFGDILSDLAAGLTGGLGIAPSANIGAQGSVGVFEPVHGSAPDIAGQDKADPRAAILSAAMMLEHLGFAEAGAGVRAACYATAHSGSTRATAEALIAAL